jgi:D-cysteine desulfhydrase family pyridoxal phosphate-dependent enzyme
MAILDETISRESLKQMLDAFPKVSLAHLPTPLNRLSRLSRKLGGINAYIKREDLTGLAFGGNKARKLDFIMADVLAQKANSFITWAGIQSNWCRQAIAAARMVGVKPIVILFKRPMLPSVCDGNLLLDVILGAEIRTIELEKGKSFMELRQVEGIVESLAEEERKLGNRPYIAPIGGSLLEGSMLKPWGAISYVQALVELLDQADEEDVTIDYVVHATGSGSTQAGLIVGAHLVAPELRVVGISVSEDCETMRRYLRSIASRTLDEFVPQTSVDENELIVFDEYIKGGYGILDQGTTRAIQLVAETEGILLDPVYTGKAMAGLLDLVNRGYFKPHSNIVFLHTGGTPALFPYRETIVSHLEEIKRA